MFSICKNTVVDGLEKTGCKLSHIQACLSDRSKHDSPKYLYLGKRVSRGTIVLHTKNGDYMAEFTEKNGWIEFLAF